MTVLLKERGQFPGEPFQPLAAKMWSEFFALAPSTCDLARWRISAHSAVVALTPRESHTDEMSPEWDPPDPIAVIVNGVIEAFDASDSKTVVARFWQYVVDGILAAFKTDAIATKFARFSRGGFAILASPDEESLSEDPAMVVLWTNDKQVTPAEIKARQKAARKRQKVKLVVRKSPAALAMVRQAKKKRLKKGGAKKLVKKKTAKKAVKKKVAKKAAVKKRLVKKRG